MVNRRNAQNHPPPNPDDDNNNNNNNNNNQPTTNNQQPTTNNQQPTTNNQQPTTTTTTTPKLQSDPSFEMSNRTNVPLMDCSSSARISAWLAPNQFPRRFSDWSFKRAGIKVSTPVVPKPFNDKSKVLSWSCDKEGTKAAKPAGPKPLPFNSKVCNFGNAGITSARKWAPSKDSTFIERSKWIKFRNASGMVGSRTRTCKQLAVCPERPHCLSARDDSLGTWERKSLTWCMVSASRFSSSTEKPSTSR